MAKEKTEIDKIDAQEVMDQLNKHMNAAGTRPLTDFVSTGSDLLDIITGGGYAFGEIVNVISDSSGGKSLLAAEAVFQARLHYGNKIKCRYLDKEAGMKFDTKTMYGFDIREDVASNVSTIQDFMGDLGSFVNKIKPDEYGFYIVDSFDSLCSDEDIAEYEERVKKFEKEEEYKKVTYDMSKQKFSSKLFRTMCDIISEKNVILFIISQTRTNVNAGLFESKILIAGGDALRFYSSTRIFLKRREDFEVTGTDKLKRTYGYCFEAHALKSRCKWPNRTCYVNILYETGIDNISTNLDYVYDLKGEYGKLDPAACKAINWGEGQDASSENLKTFLVEKGFFEDFRMNNKRASQGKMLEYITSIPELLEPFAKDFGTMERNTLISYIENNNLENELTAKARHKWRTNEEAIIQPRKKKSLGNE